MPGSLLSNLWYGWCKASRHIQNPIFDIKLGAPSYCRSKPRWPLCSHLVTVPVACSNYNPSRAGVWAKRLLSSEYRKKPPTLPSVSTKGAPHTPSLASWPVGPEAQKETSILQLWASAGSYSTAGGIGSSKQKLFPTATRSSLPVDIPSISKLSPALIWACGIIRRGKGAWKYLPFENEMEGSRETSPISSSGTLSTIWPILLDDTPRLTAWTRDWKQKLPSLSLAVA